MLPYIAVLQHYIAWTYLVLTRQLDWQTVQSLVLQLHCSRIDIYFFLSLQARFYTSAKAVPLPKSGLPITVATLLLLLASQQVKIMKDWDPTGRQGPKMPMPDVIKVHEPKEEEVYAGDKPFVGKDEPAMA
jgi:hypothetical protein